MLSRLPKVLATVNATRHRPIWLILSTLITQYLIGGLLIYSGFRKAYDPSLLGTVLYFDGFPLKFLEPAVWLVTFVEVLIGIALISGFGGNFTRWLTCALLVVFTLQLACLVMFKEPPDCGCPSLLKAFLSNRQSAVFGIIRNLFFIFLLANTRPGKATKPQTPAAAPGFTKPLSDGALPG